MSHFTTIKTQIKDGKILHQTLQQLNYVVETNSIVRGYQGIQTKGDYVIKRQNGYDIGYIKNGEVYEAVADFWGVDLQKEFMQQINQIYAQNVVMNYAQEKGYEIESQETLEDGSVCLVLGGWV
ncbi:DUF1257 domain-containing protein [Laspinema olomoucense]|uniref:DUF1257 domain-containing protein n=1 Tax=Laspinema olomoucense TaxID=3231600 RepID=UPI0021BB45C2|nr:DUF1257 domain-containing protein [Laspinema sp. D3c]MCT7992403.1 DUF1257 domain-containing protein [Laspinema sp. D3c]